MHSQSREGGKAISTYGDSREITGGHSLDELLEVLSRISYGTVSTFDGYRIRSRTMHFANTEDFVFYFASMRGDPKVVQMTLNPSINLLLNHSGEGLESTCEIEVQGKGEVIKDAQEKRMALEMLSKKSPVVKSSREAGTDDAFDVIRMVPEMVKYRVFGEIVRGVGPTVITFGGDHYSEKPWGLLGKAEVWYEELRTPFFAASIVSVLLGVAIAWSNLGVFDPRLFLLTLMGVLCLHAGTNVANDYFDHKSGNDEINRGYLRPFTGGSRMIQKGYLSPNSVLTASLLFFGMGTLIGLYLYWETRGVLIPALMLVGLFSGFFYSSPPFKFGNHGVGELLVGWNFGVLITLGAYYVQTLSVSMEVVMASIPVGLLIAAVLYVNEFPDYEADKEVGKDNLVVRFGRKKAVYGYIAMISTAYTFLVAAVFTGLITPYALLGLFTFPYAIKAVQTLRKNFENSMYLIPACVNTIRSHMYTGLLITTGYLLEASL